MADTDKDDIGQGTGEHQDDKPVNETLASQADSEEHPSLKSMAVADFAKHQREVKVPVTHLDPSQADADEALDQHSAANIDTNLAEIEAAADPKFFHLPPELRNEIYRLVLVEEDFMKVEQGNVPPEPPILGVNRKFRGEASSIFYEENVFLWHIENFDASLLCKWSKQYYHRGKMTINIINEGKPTWSNLLSWLRAYYRCQVCGLAGPGETGTNMARSSAVSLCSEHEDEGPGPGVGAGGRASELGSWCELKPGS